MDISPAHQTAVEEATRVPALHARLALLQQTDEQSTDRASIAIFGGTRPSPGGTPASGPIVTMLMTANAGAVDEQLYQLALDAPLEGQNTGAAPDTGTIPAWARIYNPAGGWWADVSVSVEGDGGEIQMVATGTEGDPAEPVVRLFNGAFARLTSALFQG
ncbi:hypothetical protein [Marinobacter oulmenensis]|uniref:Uncharacterized protein n=1 Tax=Marinobacter oulmenensis TaxID=643747 RepID=A0A840UHY1_9GAMM|nr:hypothetical protein [Marinobacter oulmenensis]MBB5322341.1 hypothetical protein [Marinobacter oulmenensis]